MALKTLNPPIPWLPTPSPPISTSSLRRRSSAVISLSVAAIKCNFDGDIAVDSGGKVKKVVDLATLGNLCVDIVLSVPRLPPARKEERKEYMERLAASPPDKRYWEAGGNCNLAIAAARLGLSCYTLGHVGNEVYGNFLLDVLCNEKISFVEMDEIDESKAISTAYETLLCWVLVDPFQKHGFCSRADFSEEPAFGWMNKLTGELKLAINQSKILFCNGYAFDELYPDLIISALNCAIDAKTAVFFDPGPRGKTLLNGTPEEKKALELFLRHSDVVLLTMDEIESLTGITNPVQAGQELIRRGMKTKWVIIKMGSKGSILITSSTISCAPSFKVNVVDTVGCGDSFTAAIVFGFLHDMPAINTLTLANAVGAATATGCGAGRNVARLEAVLDLLKKSNLNEDIELWNELIGESYLTKDVYLLSTKSINGLSGHIVNVPVLNIIRQLMPKLDAACHSTSLH